MHLLSSSPGASWQWAEATNRSRAAPRYTCRRKRSFPSVTRCIVQGERHFHNGRKSHFLTKFRTSFVKFPFYGVTSVFSPTCSVVYSCSGALVLLYIFFFLRLRLNTRDFGPSCNLAKFRIMCSPKRLVLDTGANAAKNIATI